MPNQAFIDATTLIADINTNVAMLVGKGAQLEALVTALAQGMSDENWTDVETNLDSLDLGAVWLSNKVDYLKALIL